VEEQYFKLKIAT